jgi:drug/metabolite transporter (DMT)-like permease
MTYPNDDRPLAGRNRTNRWGSWVVLGACLVAILVAALYYSGHNTTASNTSTSPTTTGSNTANPGAPRK